VVLTVLILEEAMCRVAHNSLFDEEEENVSSEIEPVEKIRIKHEGHDENYVST
jgi:hypothetical protein